MVRKVITQGSKLTVVLWSEASSFFAGPVKKIKPVVLPASEKNGPYKISHNYNNLNVLKISENRGTMY